MAERPDLAPPLQVNDDGAGEEAEDLTGSWTLLTSLAAGAIDGSKRSKQDTTRIGRFMNKI